MNSFFKNYFAPAVLEMYRPNKVGKVDVFASLTLAAASFLLALLAIDVLMRSGLDFDFYQEYFGPAVMYACGHGFTMPAIEIEALTSFLAFEERAFDCSSLPDEIEAGKDQLVREWLYLQGLLAVVWKATGTVHWDATKYAVSFLLASSSVSLYFIFRLFSERVFIAALFTFLVVLSPSYLRYLLEYRDFSKALFITTSVLLLALLVRQSESSLGIKAIIGLCLGAVIGFGYGFRPDSLIIVPLAFLVVAIACFRFHLKAFLSFGVVVATVIIGFTLSSAPIILDNQESGSCIFHFPLLGLMEPFNKALGVAPGEYELGNLYFDSLIHAMVESHWQAQGGEGFAGYCSPLYDEISGNIFISYVTTFPMDMLTRGYAAATSIFSSSFDEHVNPGNSLLVALYNAVIGLVELTNFGLFGFAGSVFLLGAINIRFAVAYFFMVGYLSFYPAIQMHERHWFHLQFLPLLPTSIFIAAALNKFDLIITSEGSLRRVNLEKFRQAALVFCSLFTAAVFALVLARSLQGIRYQELVERYQNAPRVVAALAFENNKNSGLATVSPVEDAYFRPGMMVMEFSGPPQTSTEERADFTILEDGSLDQTDVFALDRAIKRGEIRFLSFFDGVIELQLWSEGKMVHAELDVLSGTLVSIPIGFEDLDSGRLIGVNVASNNRVIDSSLVFLSGRSVEKIPSSVFELDFVYDPGPLGLGMDLSYNVTVEADSSETLVFFPSYVLPYHFDGIQQSALDHIRLNARATRALVAIYYLPELDEYPLWLTSVIEQPSGSSYSGQTHIHVVGDSQRLTPPLESLFR